MWVVSRPHAVRRDATLRAVDAAAARSRMTTTANEIRQLTRETLRVGGWEYDFDHRTVAWHAPIASIPALAPREIVSVTPSHGLEPTANDVAEWLVAPVVTTLQ